MYVKGVNEGFVSRLTISLNYLLSMKHFLIIVVQTMATKAGVLKALRLLPLGVKQESWSLGLVSSGCWKGVCYHVISSIQSRDLDVAGSRCQLPSPF